MKYIIKSILVICCLATVQSCFVAKDYERPEEIDPIKYRTDQLESDTLSISRISWKEMFTDTVLQNHIDEALENNQDIRIALQQINVANSYYKQGKAGYYPTVDINGSFTHQELSPNSQFGGFFSSLDQYELSSSLSWEADVWGKIRSNKRAAQASYMQSQAAHKVVKTELIARIASGYYQILALDEQVKITEETVQSRQNSFETLYSFKRSWKPYLCCCKAN